MEQQLNYKEGDIIYRQGKTYICEMATNTKAIFKAMSIGLLVGSGPAHTASCGNLGGPLCTDYFKIDLESPEWRCRTEQLPDGSIAKPSGQYPVIGHNGKCTQVFNMGSIYRNYPDLYASTIKNEAVRLGLISPFEEERGRGTQSDEGIQLSRWINKDAKQIPTPEPPATVLPEQPKRGRPKKAVAKKAPKKGAKTGSRKYNANGLRRRGNY